MEILFQLFTKKGKFIFKSYLEWALYPLNMFFCLFRRIFERWVAWSRQEINRKMAKAAVFYDNLLYKRVFAHLSTVGGHRIAKL